MAEGLGSFLSEASLKRALIPLLRALFSRPSHLPEALSPHTITWEVTFQHMNTGGTQTFRPEQKV